MILKTTDEILGALERGELSRDFAEAMNSCCEALVAAEEGSATLTLKIKLSAKNEVVSIKSNVTTSLPEKKRRSTTLFLTGDGRLSQQHPDQIDIFERGERSTRIGAPANG
jgi:hypothetical protein